MTDETRDALLLAVAETLMQLGRSVTIIPGLPREQQAKTWFAFDRMHTVLARAKHERDYPEDRG
jgi:hypothetical protein